uniref:conjugal transfer protein TraN n=1 Tax=Escherichia coli TaxID=562 RepID=UPI003DA1849E
MSESSVEESAGCLSGEKRSYCQFDSKLAQRVQQQDANRSARISFGSAKHP